MAANTIPVTIRPVPKMDTSPLVNPYGSKISSISDP